MMTVQYKTIQLFHMSFSLAVLGNTRNQPNLYRSSNGASMKQTKTNDLNVARREERKNQKFMAINFVTTDLGR
ncbi:hypothetical protein NT6N_38200 [Oceaniferula spumae]|uniref:Secreted protein n=1 Tax=Oceaniferula spumae TaxID=2979115 RepID=A0AAT9FS73_9BACT